ncbi:hypothetical protein ABEG93_09660, partial [Pantoea agglomerans]
MAVVVQARQQRAGGIGRHAGQHLRTHAATAGQRDAAAAVADPVVRRIADIGEAERTGIQTVVCR